MDFELTEEQEIFRESFRKFLEAEIHPLDDRFGDEEMTAERARELSKQLIPWGFLGGAAAAEVERDTTIRCIQNEELSRIFPGLAGITGMTAACAAGIAAGAHPEVAARLVEPLRQGELIGSNAISEPNVGSDASAIECRAEKQGDRWIVNGTKCWISNGHIADVTLALVQTDPAQGPAGLRHFVIDRRESPFESRETPTIGLRSFPTSELYFRDLEVPDMNRIGSWQESSGSEGAGKAFRRFMTGVAGGMIRDVLSAEVPLILRREIYATAALCGAITYVILTRLGLTDITCQMVSVFATLCIRLAAMHWHFSLPVFQARDGNGGNKPGISGET